MTLILECSICGKKRPDGRAWTTLTCSDECKQTRERQKRAERNARYYNKRRRANPVEHETRLTELRTAKRRRYRDDPEYREKVKELERQRRARTYAGGRKETVRIEEVSERELTEIVKLARINHRLPIAPPHKDKGFSTPPPSDHSAQVRRILIKMGVLDLDKAVLPADDPIHVWLASPT